MFICSSTRGHNLQERTPITTHTTKHNTPTCFVRWSEQAILMRSQVAGLSIWKGLLSPASSRAAFMASWMAKNTDAARNNGGSPTACSKYNKGCNNSLQQVQQGPAASTTRAATTACSKYNKGCNNSLQQVQQGSAASTTRAVTTACSKYNKGLQQVQQGLQQQPAASTTRVTTTVRASQNTSGKA